MQERYDAKDPLRLLSDAAYELAARSVNGSRLTKFLEILEVSVGLEVLDPLLQCIWQDVRATSNGLQQGPWECVDSK